jgi:hypothetical protein
MTRQSVIILATESEEWFGNYLFQRDGFQPSKGMRSGQRHAIRVSAQRFKLDACEHPQANDVGWTRPGADDRRRSHSARSHHSLGKLSNGNHFEPFR